MSIFTRAFWQAAAERAVKAFAYSMVSVLVGTGTGLVDTDWVSVLSLAGMTALLSVLGSIGSDALTGNGPSLTNAETIAADK